MDYTCTVQELEHQLKEAGEQLLVPPSSTKELLDLLDKVEQLLTVVGQAPSTSMQGALVPSMGALISDELLRHTDVDVRVSVASCLGEIARITAPEPPYKDETMKEIFQLNVMAFGKLLHVSGHSYSKAVHILESVAKVKSCLLMLDLECNALIVEMFEKFLSTIRSNHPHAVFSDMETIMTLVIEESDEIPVELLSLLLSHVKKENQNVSSVPWKLAEKVLRNCADILKPYSQAVMKLLSSHPDNYAEVVASICQNTHGNELVVAKSVMDDGTRKTDDTLENGGSAKTLMHCQPKNKGSAIPKKKDKKPNILSSKEDDALHKHRLKRKELQESQHFSSAHESHSTNGQLKNKKRILNQETSPDWTQDSEEDLLSTQFEEKALHPVELASKEKFKSLRGAGGKTEKCSRKTKGVSNTNMKTSGAPNDVVVKKENEVLSDFGGAEEPLFHQMNDKTRSRKKPSSKKHIAAGSHGKDFKDACNFKEYGEDLVGRRVQVWWPLDKMFYEGAVFSYDPTEKKHKVLYADGDEEILDLRFEKWKLLDDRPLDQQERAADLPNPTTLPVKQRKKKAKSKSESSLKQEDTSHSPKSQVSASLSRTEPAREDDIRGADGSTTNTLGNVDDRMDDVAQILDIRYGLKSTETPDTERHKMIDNVEHGNECRTSNIARGEHTCSQAEPNLSGELENLEIPDSAEAEENHTKTGKKRRRLVKSEEFI